MNGYRLLADSYRKLMNEGKIDKDVAEKEIRVLEFLATCDRDDLCRMVDSSAFNDIIKAYVELAVDGSGIGKAEKEKVKGQMRWIFDGNTADEVLKKYGYV